MATPNFSALLPDATLRQIEELKPLYNGNKTQIVIQAIKLLHQQEKRTMSSQITLKFVAQSGHVWEETVDTDEMDSFIRTTVATHGDIERVEKLANPNDISGEVVWRFEN